jgi:hypothetical protein
LVASGGDLRAGSASLKSMGFNPVLEIQDADIPILSDSSQDLYAALARSLGNAVSSRGGRFPAPKYTDSAMGAMNFRSLREIARRQSESGLSQPAIEAATFRFLQPSSSSPALGAARPEDDDDMPPTSSSAECPICVAALRAGEECRRLPCLHVFHVPCIDSWLGRNRLCPTCKKDVVAAAVARV